LLRAVSSMSFRRSRDINLTDILTTIINDIINRTSLFSHVDINRLLVCIAYNRQRGRGGTFGKLVPLKFKGGLDVVHYRGEYYSMPRIFHRGKRLLYLVYFYIPMFFNLSPQEKLAVIFHELFHINPDFNGDIRRLGNAGSIHGYSRITFNSLFERELVSFCEYVRGAPSIDFLGMNAEYLKKSYSRVYGQRMKLPKPVIVR
jgi:hypothetical protein